MKEIFFIVEKDTKSGFTAKALEFSIFTEAETLEELKINIKESLECHFDDYDFRAREILIEKK